MTLLTKDEIKTQNALIGEFIVGFEQVLAAIRFTILKILFPNFSVIQNNNVEILLEGLTADPLRKKLDALIHDNYTSEIELLSLNKVLSNHLNDLLQVRNSIAHSSKLLGWKSFNGDLSPETFLLKHSKTTKSGLDRNSMIINISEIKKLIKQIQIMDSAYMTICVLIDKEISDQNKTSYLNNLKEGIALIGKISLECEIKVEK